MASFIGLSVTKCFPDMVIGEVDPACVSKIIAGIGCPPDRIDALIKEYREWRWAFRIRVEYRRDNAGVDSILDEVEALFRKFLLEGRIEQPRLISGKVPDIYRKDAVHWVTDEGKIQWMDY